MNWYLPVTGFMAQPDTAAAEVAADIARNPLRVICRLFMLSFIYGLGL